MIDKQVIAYLKLLHSFYNSIVMIMIFYQGLLGFRIRRERKTGKVPFYYFEKHRKLGPILAVESAIGFFVGATVVYLDHGHILKYPLHFIVGFLIVLSMFVTFRISKRILSSSDFWRDRHYILGIMIISFYIIQMIIGLEILL